MPGMVVVVVVVGGLVVVVVGGLVVVVVVVVVAGEHVCGETPDGGMIHSRLPALSTRSKHSVPVIARTLPLIRLPSLDR